MLRTILVLLACAVLVLPACRGSRIETQGTTVAPGDTLYGRLPADRSEQAFSFEGVESAMLDFTLRADEGNKSAPDVSLIDPEGRSVDLSAATQSAHGAATMQVRDVVLLRNGIYKLTVHPPIECQDTFYSFQHCLRFPVPAPTKVRLTAETTHPIFVSAPRGGLIVFEMRPVSGNVVPAVQAVEDPWGGRALDKSQVPEGALPPRVSRGHLGEMVLTFTAPRPGRYKILATSKDGTSGVTQLSVQVRKPRNADRVLNHPNTLPHFGVPGDRVPAEPARATTPMPPPPPSTQTDDVLAPPGQQWIPPDPSIAQR